MPVTAFFRGLAVGALTLGCAAAALAQVPPAASDGGPRRFEIVGGPVTARAGPSETAEPVGVVQDGAILANLGCTLADGAPWCEVRRFRGGARVFVPGRHLAPAAGPDGAVPMGLDSSPRRARAGDFDASGEIVCAQERGQALGLCRAEVARGTGGDATVVATFANGFARHLYFLHGEFVAANATMSGVGTDTDWRLDGGQHHLRVDDQRFVLSGQFVFGN